MVIFSGDRLDFTPKIDEIGEVYVTYLLTVIVH